MTYRNTTIKR